MEKRRKTTRKKRMAVEKIEWKASLADSKLKFLYLIRLLNDSSK